MAYLHLGSTLFYIPATETNILYVGILCKCALMLWEYSSIYLNLLLEVRTIPSDRIVSKFIRFYQMKSKDDENSKN